MDAESNSSGRDWSLFFMMLKFMVILKIYFILNNEEGLTIDD